MSQDSEAAKVPKKSSRKCVVCRQTNHEPGILVFMGEKRGNVFVHSNSIEGENCLRILCQKSYGQYLRRKYPEKSDSKE